MISSTQYVKDFFGQSMFAVYPFGLGDIIKHGYIWSILLLAPFVLLKKLKDWRMLLGLFLSCFFLLAFHRFYGASEVRLFMPVIAAILLCLLVFSAQVISRKIALCVASALLIVVLPLNLLGAYNTHIISEFVFGELDSGDWQNYKNDIDRFVEISKKDDLNKFLLYQSLKKNK